MGQNLMNYKRPAKQREMELHLNALQSILGANNSLSGQTIQDRINELEGMKQTAEGVEKIAYKAFDGVKSIGDLQIKIDKINQHLLVFSNKAIRAMPIQKKLGVSTYQETESMLLNKIFGTDEVQETIDDISEQMIEDAWQEFNTLMKSLGEQTVRKSDFKANVVASAKTLKEKRIKDRNLKGYKTRLDIWLNPKKVSTYSYNLTVTAKEQEQDMDVNYYPYINLSQNEKVEAQARQTRKSKYIWTRFITKLSQCAGPYQQLAYQLLSTQFEPKDFFAETSANVMGILGELQTTIILTALVGDMDRVRFFANDLQDGKKIGVDVALDAIGFQVKNYQIQNWGGISLSEHYSLSLFLEKLLAANMNPDVVTDLGNFYALQAYHVMVDSDYAETQEKTNQLGKRIKLWLQGYGTAFLPLQEFQVRGLNLSNVFYFIGGERIVPISFIINSYIKYLRELMNQGLQKKGRIATFSIDVSSIPSTYRQYYEAVYKGAEKIEEDKSQFIGYKSIQESLAMDVRLNMALPSVEEILKRQPIK